jgi:hypothetical protein
MSEPPTIRMSRDEKKAMQLACLEAAELSDEELAAFDLDEAVGRHLKQLRESGTAGQGTLG